MTDVSSPTAAAAAPSDAETFGPFRLRRGAGVWRIGLPDEIAVADLPDLRRAMLEALGGGHALALEIPAELEADVFFVQLLVSAWAGTPRPALTGPGRKALLARVQALGLGGALG